MSVCVSLCVCVSFRDLSVMSGLKSGFLFPWKTCGDREEEIKGTMSFTDISLIDHIDIFDPRVLFLFESPPPPPFDLAHLKFKHYCFLLVSSSLFFFLLFELQLFFFIVTRTCPVCLSGCPSRGTRENVEQTSALSCLCVC